MNLKIGSNGVIAIIGKTNYAVTIQVTGFDPCGDIVHLVNKFGKNCIQTHPIGKSDYVIYFEYNLRSELRNPDRLLKILRGKLIKASHIVHSELMQMMIDLDPQLHHTFHRAP